MMNANKIEYLEGERQKLWQEIVAQKDINKGMQTTIDLLQSEINSLKVDVEKKTSDYERDAKNSSRMVSQYKNKTKKISEEADGLKETIVEHTQSAKSLHSKLKGINAKYESVIAQDSEITEAYSNIISAKENFLLEEDAVGQTLLEVKELLQSAESIHENISELQLEIKSVSEKVTSFHSQTAKKKKEVDDVYKLIFGYVYEDEDTGEEIAVDGLKHELDEAYVELKNDVASFTEDISDFKEKKIEEYESFCGIKNDEFEKIKEKIRGLLPEAMTAGLSHAYEAKRKTEEGEEIKASRTFKQSIIALSVVSVLPVVVSIYSLITGKTLDETVQNLPRLVLGILPLYTPVFWFAISANRRIKLAKRLIEEYAHKEALSKTFEGLSSQIENLEDSETSRELRVKLLYNIISVSSENPGKLISNYDQSDNPILDALNKSLSFSKSLEKMTAIPGVELILQKVVKQQKEKEIVIKKAVEEVVEEVEADEGE